MSALVIDDVEIARALHVVFVAHWIGGVAFVALVGLPLARASGDAKKGWSLFEAIETRFAAQVRVSIPLAGATGLWMAWRLDLWGMFAEPAAWWMDAMVLLWALFMLIVFVIEPLAHRRLAVMATFRRLAAPRYSRSRSHRSPNARSLSVPWTTCVAATHLLSLRSIDWPAQQLAFGTL